MLRWWRRYLFWTCCCGSAHRIVEKCYAAVSKCSLQHTIHSSRQNPLQYPVENYSMLFHFVSCFLTFSFLFLSSSNTERSHNTRTSNHASEAKNECLTPSLLLAQQFHSKQKYEVHYQCGRTAECEVW